MKREELLPFLADFAKKVASGDVSSQDLSIVKNYIRETYDAGNLDKETMSDLGKKASHNFKNKGRVADLQDMTSKIIEKGGQVGKFDEAFVPTAGKVFRSAKDAASAGAKKAGKGLKSFAPLLGMLGKALPIAGTAAGLASGDVFAADPTGALQTEELGAGSDEIPKDEQFDFTPYKTENKPKFENLKNKLAGK